MANDETDSPRLRSPRAGEPESKNIIKILKSIYLIKKIFSNLIIYKELDMLKYNKNMQQDFNYNIEYYKKVSGKYIIGKRNGKGKDIMKKMTN